MAIEHGLKVSLLNKLYVELNKIFIFKATFCNVYLMLFSFNIITTLNYDHFSVKFDA